MEQLKNELNKIEIVRQRALIRAILLSQYRAEKCSEAALLERLEFLKTRTILELQVGDHDPNAPLEADRPDRCRSVQDTGEPYPPIPAPHSDGLPEHLRPMVEAAMNGARQGLMVPIVSAYGSGLVRDVDEYVLEWYKTFLQNHSDDALERLEAMFRALSPAEVTWEKLGVEVRA